MATRTLRFYGLGYGSATVDITATVDGTTVYTGTITTLDQPEYNLLPDQQSILFTTTCDTAFAGTKPVTVTVNNGTLILAQTWANYYGYMPNPVFTPEQYAIVSVSTAANSPERSAQVDIWTATANPALSAEDITSLTSSPLQDVQNIFVVHNIQSDVLDPASVDVWLSPYTSDSHTSVTINGVAQPAPVPDLSDVYWLVPNGQIITFNQNILAS